MITYKEALKLFLDKPENTQNALAEAIGKTQVSVHRYVNGDRFPDADTARAIDKHTAGAVSFVVWQAEFLKRSGLAA